MSNQQRTLGSLTKVTIISIILGALLTCASIVFVGKKAHFSPCDYSGRSTNTLNRGAPLTYFKVTPSESTCVNVDYTSAVFASDVGNDISFKALFADWIIWSAVSSGAIIMIRRAKYSRTTASDCPQ
jgi:hypothetical protein